MQQDTLARWTAEARALGIEQAECAAGWAFDGNSTRDERARVLDMLREGDPAAWDYLPAMPNLSGEWADALTPHRLFEQIVGREPETDDDGDVIEALADAFENGV